MTEKNKMSEKLVRMERRNYPVSETYITDFRIFKLLTARQFRRYKRFNLTQYQKHENNEEQD